jgi:hypothetical protein
LATTEDADEGLIRAAGRSPANEENEAMNTDQSRVMHQMRR